MTTEANEVGAEGIVRKPRAPKPTGPKTISHQLRKMLERMIEDRETTAYRIAETAGIDHKIIGRFLSDQRGLTLASVDKIAVAYGLKIVESGVRPKGKTRAKGKG